MREGRSVLVTAWVSEDPEYHDVHNAFDCLLRAIQEAVEEWHQMHEAAVDGVPVVNLR